MFASLIIAMRLQRTIKEAFTVRGVGLHTGADVKMSVHPAPHDHGVIFMRLDKAARIRADISSVTDTAFATTIGIKGAQIKTVEHLLAAAAGLGIDNLYVEVTGPEVPAMDGSAEGFARLLSEAGIVKQPFNRPYIKITKQVSFVDKDAQICALPYEGQAITFTIDFDHAVLGEQNLSLVLDKDSFREELASARTFGFLKDVERLQSMGLAKGGSLDNAVILTETGVLNPEGLRYTDECVRHKALDFIGDLSLAGFPIHGHFVVKRSGHTANAKFLRYLFAHPECWQLVTEVPAAALVAMA